MRYMVLDRVHNEWPLNMSACEASITFLHRFIWVRWKQTTSSGCVTSGSWLRCSCWKVGWRQLRNQILRPVSKHTEEGGIQRKRLAGTDYTQPARRNGMCSERKKKKGLWRLHWCSANLSHSVCVWLSWVHGEGFCPTVEASSIPSTHPPIHCIQPLYVESFALPDLSDRLERERVYIWGKFTWLYTGGKRNESISKVEQERKKKEKWNEVKKMIREGRTRQKRKRKWVRYIREKKWGISY